MKSHQKESNIGKDIEQGTGAPPEVPKPGAHLASGEVYRKKIVDLEGRNPTLKHKDWKIPKTQERERHVIRSRAKLLKFNKLGAPESTGQELTLRELRDSLSSRKAFRDSEHVGYLYLLEGLNPEYVEAFGEYLNIDPGLFSRHQRTALWEGRHDGGISSKLASLEDPSKGFTMEYCELLYFAESPDTTSLRNPNDNRHINVSRKPKISKDIDLVGIMHRKASFWSQTDTNNSWEGEYNPYLREGARQSLRSVKALLIMDPPPPKTGEDESIILQGTSKDAKPVAMQVDLYQGGYLDFVDPTSLSEATRALGPPRTCVMDDLCFYWTHHKEICMSTSSLVATTFLQKIIASNYMMLEGYLGACLNELETDIRLTHIDKGKKNQTLQISEQWSILQSWSHRFPEYCGMIDDIMSRRKIPGNDSPPHEWTDCTRDFQEIKERMAELRRRAEMLNESFVGLAGMAGMQESLDEAKNVQLLTFLGLFFLPLSYISSLFAMPENYGPEKSRFWIYCSIAFPFALGFQSLGWLFIYLIRPKLH
ncbi:MAG: hypothetical protein Q9160_004781 [Pyrenula sp. 1 TL-2023]